MDDDIRKRILAAQGFTELELYDEALEELSDLDPEHEAIATLCCHVLSLQSKWDEMSELAGKWAARSPDEAQWWISWAYAVRRAESVDAAREILLKARDRHPEEPMILYNLACYASVSGELEAAGALLEQAIERDAGFRRMAAEDDDLKPLFD